MNKFMITTAAFLAFSMPTLATAEETAPKTESYTQTAGKNVMYNMSVKNMMCASCAARAKKAIKKMDGVKSVKVKVVVGGLSTVSVCAAPTTKFTESGLKHFFETKGFAYKGKTTGSC